MEFDVRYKLRHIGDIFIDLVQKTADTALKCSKGVYLTYDIQLLGYKKDQISRSIAERVALLIKEGHSDVSKDAALAELIARLNSAEKEIADYESQRKNLVNLCKTKKA